MSIIKVTRTLISPTLYRKSLLLRSFREVSRSYFGHERGWVFVIEALLFAVIAAISAWPIFNAAVALSEFFQRTGI